MPAHYSINRRVPQNRGTAWPRPSFSAARLAPENHSEHETDAQRGHDRFGWVFAHVLFGIVLKRANTIFRIAQGLLGPTAGIVPRLLGFAAVLFRHCACRGA